MHHTMDSAYPIPVVVQTENAAPRSAFTRFQVAKSDFTPAIAEDTVPSELFSTFKVQIGPPHPSRARTAVRSTVGMPYNNTAIPPPEEITGSASLPRTGFCHPLRLCQADPLFHSGSSKTNSTPGRRDQSMFEQRGFCDHCSNSMLKKPLQLGRS